MSKTVLPFTLVVPSMAYHNRAFPLGIMKANLKDFDAWLCNKLIQCIYEPDYDRYNLYDEDIWGYRDNIAATQSFHVFPEILHCPSFDILGIAKNMLDRGYYVAGLNNERCVRAKAAYQKYDHVHDYIIFGYDDELRAFKSAGYIANQKYDYFDLYYEDYLDSLRAFCFHNLPFYFHRVNREASISIKYDEIQQKIEDYLLSRKDRVTKTTVASYGISVWKRLASHTASMATDKGNLDIRAYRAMMEHKTIMLDRIRILSERHFIANATREYRDAVVQPAAIVYALSLKYNMTLNQNLLARIATNIEILCLSEERILSNAFFQR